MLPSCTLTINAPLNIPVTRWSAITTSSLKYLCFYLRLKRFGLNWISVTYSLTYYQAKSSNYKLINAPKMVKLGVVPLSCRGERTTHISFTDSTNPCNRVASIYCYSVTHSMINWVCCCRGRTLAMYSGVDRYISIYYYIYINTCIYVCTYICDFQRVL
jgi:hypothetical protein